MTVNLLNPRGTSRDCYHHVSAASGTQYVHLAGQVAWDEHGHLAAPGDLAGQVPQVLHNVTRTSMWRRPPSLTSYASPGSPWTGTRTRSAPSRPAWSRQRPRLTSPPFPASLIGVSVPSEPGILNEAEATAVVDHRRARPGAGHDRASDHRRASHRLRGDRPRPSRQSWRTESAIAGSPAASTQFLWAGRPPAMKPRRGPHCRAVLGAPY